MKRLLLSLFFFGLLILMAIGAYIKDENKLLHQPFNLADSNVQPCFVLERGMPLSQFANILTEANLLKNKKSWLYWARYKQQATKVKAGEYCLKQGDSPVSLLNQMVDGKTVQHSFTLIEGWNYRQVLQAIQKNLVLIKTIDPMISAEALAQKLGIKESNIEGLLATDTFFFDRGTTDKQLLLRAYKEQQQRLQKAWKNRADDLPYKTPYDALIMASIVEKETGAAFERPEIAGVFVRRLAIPMRLQTDPTVIYGLGVDYQGNITRKNLESHTPYNTYLIDGLPPTPIAMPSQAAIDAALHPKEGNSLYFVAKGDGTHYFSSTLNEHQNAVNQYQLRRRSDYRSSPTP